MDREVTAWMEKYVKAWRSNDPLDIRELFSEDAVYATRPHDPEPWQGRDEIVRRWIAVGDDPSDWSFEWALLGRDGDLAFVQSATEYVSTQTTQDNLWIIRFEPDGRASSFTEWSIARK